MAHPDRPTLLDIARQSDPDGKPAKVVEVLDQVNPVLQDAPAYPSNAPMGNRVTMRSSLPTVAWGKVNKGVTISKGATKQVVDTMGLLVGLSEVDSKLKKIVGDAQFNAKRWSEDKAFLESMGQTVANTIFYGDELTSEAAFTGFQPRLQTKATALTGSQIRAYKTLVGGQTDITSMYVIDWGPDTAHLIYPENSVAGVDVRNLGEQRVTDEDSNPMMAYVTGYEWLVGLTVKDPRHIARLGDIDVSVADADTGLELGLALINILTAMPPPNGANRVIYCNQAIEAAFIKQALAKTNAALTMADYLGKLTTHFWGYPIRRCDQISVVESALS